MNLISILFFVFTIIGLVSIILLNLTKKKETRIRIKESPRDRYSRSAVSRKIEEISEKRSTAKQREEIENLCVQAGFDLTYTEFVSLRLGASLFTIVVFSLFFRNVLWSLPFAVPVWFVIPSIFGVLRNRRISKIEEQLGSFMNMAINRYRVAGNMTNVLMLMADEYVGIEPLYSELLRVREMLKRGMRDIDALSEFARRSGNPYLKLFSDSYKNAAELGHKETTDNLLNDAYTQYNEHITSRIKLEKEVHKAKKDVWLMLATVGVSVVMGASVNENYLYFMSQTTWGRIGTFTIVGTVVLVIITVIKYVDAPIR